MKLNSDFILRTVAGEHMLVNTRGRHGDISSFFSINDTVVWLWKKIDGREFTEDELVSWISKEYDVSQEDASKDVADLIKMWRTYGILAE